MTLQDALHSLCFEDLQAFKERVPVGLNHIDIAMDVVDIAQGSQLDLVASNFDLARFVLTDCMGNTQEETDQDFRNRILKALRKVSQDNNSIKSHVHTWKLYEGFTNQFEYCTV